MKTTAPKSENLEGRRVKKNQKASFSLRKSSARAGAFLGALPQAGMVLGLGPGSPPQRGDPYQGNALGLLPPHIFQPRRGGENDHHHRPGVSPRQGSRRPLGTGPESGRGGGGGHFYVP